MKSMKSLVLIAVLAQLLIGCSSRPVFKDPKEPNHSLVLMHIDMTDAPTYAHWARATQFTPTQRFYYRFGSVPDDKLGTILHNQEVEMGKYKFTAFGGSAGNTNYTFGFPPTGGLAKMQIKKPGIYYVGSFKYSEVKTGFFEKGKFNIEKQDKPTEKEVLTRFLKHVEKEGKWRRMIEKRLRELK